MKDEEAAETDAVENPLEALDAWRREAEAAEAKAQEEFEMRMTETECTTLAKGENEATEEAVDVEPGSMRLVGTFAGSATTHTHQLDLAVGLDLEMPSEVAAEAMKQLEASSRSASPAPLKLKNVPNQSPPPEDPYQSRSLWGSLHDFFRRDARDAARAQQNERKLPQVTLCLEDNSAERARLSSQLANTTSQLQTTEGQAAQLEAAFVALQEERDELAQQLELATAQQSEQAAHIDSLRLQGQRCLQSSDDIGAQLSDKEEEVRSLEAKLLSHGSQMEALKASVEEERAARERMESMMNSERSSSTALNEENAKLRSEIAELRVRSSGLEAKAQALQDAMAATPEKKGAASPGSPASPVQEKLASLSERLTGIATERDELRGQLGAASATAEAAQARVRELESKVAELTGKAAEAEAFSSEAKRCLEQRDRELEALRQEAAAAEQAVKQAKQSEQAHAAEASSLALRLQEEQARAEEARREASTLAAASAGKGADSTQAVAQLQKELASIRDELRSQSGELHAERQQAALAKETLQVECERLAEAAEAQKKTNLEMLQEVNQAKIEHASALAAKAALDAKISHQELDMTRMTREHSELLAKVGALTALEQARHAEIKELMAHSESLKQQLSSKANLPAIREDSNPAEVARLQKLLAAEETAASELREQQVASVKAAEESRVKADSANKRLAELELRMADQIGNAERRVEAAQKEAKEAVERAQQAAGERDRARKELREAQQAGLGDAAKATEELHAQRHVELKSSALEEELAKLKRRCASLEAVRDHLTMELNLARSTPSYGGGPVLLQDNSGACLIRTINAVPTVSTAQPVLTAVAPQPVPSSAGTSIQMPPGSAAVASTASLQVPLEATSASVPPAAVPVHTTSSVSLPAGTQPVGTQSMPVGTQMTTSDGKRLSYIGTTTTQNGVPVPSGAGPAVMPVPTYSTGVPASPLPTSSGMPVVMPGPIVSLPYAQAMPNAHLASAVGQVRAKMNVRVVGVRRIR